MMKRRFDVSFLNFRVGKERGLAKPVCGGLAVVVGRSQSRALHSRERERMSDLKNRNRDMYRARKGERQQ